MTSIFGSKRAGIRVLAYSGVIAATMALGASPVFAVGAIAVDDQIGMSASEAGYGIGHGEDRSSAERHAIHQCRRAGNDSCKVVVWYNTCGAYAASMRFFGIGYGVSEDIARHDALARCNHEHCRIVVSDCDSGDDE